MRVEIIPPNLTAEDLAILERAVKALERPSFAARLANQFGRPIDLIAMAIPAAARKLVAGAAESALRAAARAAISSLAGRSGKAHAMRDRALLAASGAFGGAFGLAGLPIELPVSTVLLLRAIADSARAEGEDLSDPEAALNCLQVFAMGGRTKADDAAESAYFALRAVLAQAVSESVKHAARGGAIDATAPALARYLAQVAARFGIVVTEKAAAQAIPMLGAAGGAAINLAFAAHFQGIAGAHFAVRRLERRYGPAPVRAEYERFRAKL